MNTTSSDTTNDIPAKILIVDDSKAVRHVLQENLTAAGFDITEAENGQQGLDIAAQQPFDLIITDVDMPVMDGIEMASFLKADLATSKIPIIVLSANDEDDLVEEGFRVGVDAYLAKGDDIKDNVLAIQNLLKTRQLLTGSRILVVDDSQSIRAFLMAGLIGEGFKVEAASNGEEALVKLGTFKPDLIISDLMMPEMDGAELCKTLKQSEGYNTIPIIMMSNINDKPVMRRLMREGASSFLIKPFTINQLTIHIEEMFSTNYRVMRDETEGMAKEQSLTMGALTSVINALEARESHSRGQSERVAHVAGAIGQELGMSPKEVERLKLGGRLHDLGMIAVRDSVLLKKGPLTNEEYALVKTHTKVAEEILLPIPSLEDIMPAVTAHHERFDGSGYPEGLKGEDIPLVARIMAVADVYEALSSERPYRDSLPPFVAADILTEDRGTKFCPECIDAFMRWFDKTSGEFDLPPEFLAE